MAPTNWQAFVSLSSPSSYSSSSTSTVRALAYSLTRFAMHACGGTVLLISAYPDPHANLLLTSVQGPLAHGRCAAGHLGINSLNTLLSKSSGRRCAFAARLALPVALLGTLVSRHWFRVRGYGEAEATSAMPMPASGSALHVGCKQAIDEHLATTKHQNQVLVAPG